MDELEQLEEGLRWSLRHVPAPEGFTGRVMQRVAERKAARARSLGLGRRGHLFAQSNRSAWWAAAAAALAIAVGGGDVLHVRHQREARQAQAAQAQVDLAMQLTSHALNEVELGLDRSPAGRFTQLGNEAQR